MKSKVYAIALLATLSLTGALQAQDTIAPAPAAIPRPPAAPPAPQQVANALPENPAATDTAAESAPDNPYAAAADVARRAVNQARQEADQLRQRADQIKEQAESAAKGALDSLDSAMAGEQWSSAPSAALPGTWQSSPYGAFIRDAQSEGSLVIRTSESDPNALANAEEDLNIMGRILEKAVVQNAEDDQPQAMGIRLLTLSGHPSLRNLQIEGFGAVFFLNVNFPLVGPARTTGNNDEKQPSNSTWDEAKRELYGPAPGAEGFNENSSKEAYDPKRVEKLKDMVLQALKNATNIRSLKSDESVMVVVNGSNGGDWTRATRFQNRLARLSGGSGGGTVGARGGGNNQPGFALVTEKRMHAGSVLTIQAKKTDIDAFASGKLDLDKFRTKVKMLAYPAISGPNADQGFIIPQTK